MEMSIAGIAECNRLCALRTEILKKPVNGIPLRDAVHPNISEQGSGTFATPCTMLEIGEVRFGDKGVLICIQHIADLVHIGAIELCTENHIGETRCARLLQRSLPHALLAAL
jgi:hypothetical protein